MLNEEPVMRMWGYLSMEETGSDGKRLMHEDNQKLRLKKKPW